MDRAVKFVRAKLWPAQLPEQAWLRYLILGSRYAFALGRDYVSGELSLRAMSLVYTTMLAIAPVLAFSFSVAKGLGFHRELEPLLQRFLEPIGERANEISTNIVTFVDNVNGSVLASVSIAVMLYSALSMAQKVEGSFNFVWRVDRPRSLARRLTEYLSLMFVGPFIMIIAMSLIAALSSTAFVARLSEIGPIGAMIAGISALLPYVLVIGAFSFLYVVIPNARVRLGPALAGGLFAGIAWATCGQLFTQTVVATSRYQAIYSGFAVVFVLMIWMYLNWLILLLGAQLAFYVQNPDYLRMGQRTETLANAVRERLALSVMLLIGQDFEKPGHGWRNESLAAELRVPYHFLDPVMAALFHNGLVTQTSEQRLIPARGLRRITVAQILSAVREPAEGRGGPDLRGWNGTVAGLAERIDGAIHEVVGKQTLADLVDSDEVAEPRA